MEKTMDNAMEMGGEDVNTVLFGFKRLWLEGGKGLSGTVYTTLGYGGYRFRCSRVIESMV